MRVKHALTLANSYRRTNQLGITKKISKHKLVLKFKILKYLYFALIRNRLSF